MGRPVAFRVRLVLSLRRFWGLTPPLGTTRSRAFSTNQATALKPPVQKLGPDQPDAAIGLNERVDFHVGELDAPFAQGPKGVDRSLEKIRRNSSSVRIWPMISYTVRCAMIYTP